MGTSWEFATQSLSQRLFSFESDEYSWAFSLQWFGLMNGGLSPGQVGASRALEHYVARHEREFVPLAPHKVDWCSKSPLVMEDVISVAS